MKTRIINLMHAWAKKQVQGQSGQLIHCLKIQFWVGMGTQEEKKPRNTTFTNTDVHNHLYIYIYTIMHTYTK